MIAPPPLTIWLLVSSRPDRVSTTPDPDPCADVIRARPGTVDCRMFSWLSAPVPSSSSTNVWLAGGGVGMADAADALPD